MQQRIPNLDQTPLRRGRAIGQSTGDLGSPDDGPDLAVVAPVYGGDAFLRVADQLAEFIVAVIVVYIDGGGVVVEGAHVVDVVVKGGFVHAVVYVIEAGKE